MTRTNAPIPPLPALSTAILTFLVRHALAAPPSPPPPPPPPPSYLCTHPHQYPKRQDFAHRYTNDNHIYDLPGPGIPRAWFPGPGTRDYNIETGIVVGVIAGAVAAAILVIWVWWRCNHRKVPPAPPKEGGLELERLDEEEREEQREEQGNAAAAMAMAVRGEWFEDSPTQVNTPNRNLSTATATEDVPPSLVMGAGQMAKKPDEDDPKQGSSKDPAWRT